MNTGPRGHDAGLTDQIGWNEHRATVGTVPV